LILILIFTNNQEPTTQTPPTIDPAQSQILEAGYNNHLTQ